MTERPIERPMERSVPRIFSPARRQVRYRRALDRQRGENAARFVFDDMIEDVLERLDFTRAEPGSALVIGDVTGQLAPELRARGFDVENAGPDRLDEEQPFPRTFRYILNLGLLDTLNDLPGALVHARHALEPDGMMIAQCLGAGTLSALRQAVQVADGNRTYARIHPQIDRPAASGLMSRAGFPKQVVDSRVLHARYREPGRLVADLRDQGLTGILADAPPAFTRSEWARAQAGLEPLREEDGKVTETFEILSLTGWS
jgi:SAM-dependent methyltransferase|tara:strand:- start:1814 stop:2590 length:777 start_codon:yes stop_codon:yes gene_type:complete